MTCLVAAALVFGWGSSTPLESLLNQSAAGSSRAQTKTISQCVMPPLHHKSKLNHPSEPSIRSPDVPSPGRSNKARKKSGRSVPAKDPTEGLTITHPNAAGIDVGGDTHWVALPPGRTAKTVRTFGCFTSELEKLADWLVEHRIDTVVMESTGVYWVILYEVLERRGLKVYLINARLAKKLLSRKTDLMDCQWLQRLHAYGLLNNSFRAPEEIRVLRAYLRLRERATLAASQAVQHMQKALVEMNVQLATVISDITGETGLRIIDAILAGERDSVVLAKMKDPRIKAKWQTLAESLRGQWKDEHLLALEQARLSWEHFREQSAQCQERVEAHLRRLNTEPSPQPQAVPSPSSEAKPTVSTEALAQPSPPAQKPPPFDLRAQLKQLAGVDLCQINGIKELTAQVVLSEVGTDMSAWPTEKHFASWLALCPEHEISGGKILRRGRKRRVHQRAAQALRMAAYGLERSDSAHGAKYRRLKRKLGAPKAVVAMAHHLARLVYRMLKHGQEYVDKGAAWYEARYLAQQRKWLEKKAAEMKLKLVPVEEVA
jgi:transposase